MPLEIREAAEGDLPALLALYAHLHPEPPPEPGRAEQVWSAILSDPNHYVLLGLEAGRAVSSCVLLVIPNLTRSARPYALIENVVTHLDFRGGGRATELLRRAAALAEEAGCYKVMLLTGRKDEATLRFYRSAGFRSEDKTAFVRWLQPYEKQQPMPPQAAYLLI
jgi:GNAT superfamily N-acetyltransferase